MSRPHDGHSLFPNVGNPFRTVASKRSSDQSVKFNHILNAFEISLTGRLKQLEPKILKDMINLSWMQQAMGVLSATHADLKSLITSLQFPATEWDEKWMDEYLDDTVKLMDICLALNVEISKLEHFQLLVHYVLHLLDFSDGVWSNDKLFRAKGSLQELKGKMDLKGRNGVNSQRNNKIENCTMILQAMSKSLQFGKAKSSSKSRVFLRAMYGVKVTTIFLCSAVASALAGHPGPLIELRVSDQYLWSTAFTSLQQGINGEINRCFASGRGRVVKELVMLDAAIEKVHPIVENVALADIVDETEKVEQLRVAIQGLQQSVQLLAQGLDPLSEQTSKSSLGDALYRTITVDYSSAENVLSLLDLSTEHIALEMENRLEASIYTWKRRLHSRQSISIEDGKISVKSSWSLVKESETELGKKELYMERAENILLNLKNKFPSIPQTFLDITKIQYNRDVGHSILESYSRVLESLAYNILSRINDVIREDDFAQASQRNPTAFVSADNEFTKPSVFLPSLRKHKTRNLDCCHFPSESPSPPLSPSSIGTPEPRLHHQADTSKLGALVGEALLNYVSRESCFSESDYKDASEELPTSARKSSVPISPRLANAWCYGKEVCRSLSCTNSP